MKKFLLAALILTGITLTGCGAVANSGTKPPTSIPIKIIIGEKTFDAILADTPSSQALIEKFPLDIEMREFNGNEKYYTFEKNLPTRDTSVMLIRTGDIMLWASNTVVIFYQDFQTFYNYTPLGKIMNTDGLIEAVGNGNIRVRFEK